MGLGSVVAHDICFIQKVFRDAGLRCTDVGAEVYRVITALFKTRGRTKNKLQTFASSVIDCAALVALWCLVPFDDGLVVYREFTFWSSHYQLLGCRIN